MPGVSTAATSGGAPDRSPVAAPRHRWPGRRRPSRPRVRAALLELLLVAALWTLYRIGRLVRAPDVALASANAERVWGWERWLHLPRETAVNRAFLDWELLGQVASRYYATVHFPLTVAVLAWLWLRRPAMYPWFRTTMAVLSGAALVLHIAFPLAPPRMMTGWGFVDLGASLGTSVYGPPASDRWSNQYAAMPSLHVGWALLVAVVMVAALSSRWRWLWVAHPLITLLVVVGTANHYWADAIVVSVLLGLAFTATRGLWRGRVSRP
jgi:hypothetical protein